MKIHEDPLFTFELERQPGVLRFLWTEKTACMTDEDFKRALSLYADFAGRFAVRGLLVDVRNFKHRPGPDIGKWRDEQILPKYLKAGVQQFAYVVGQNSPMLSGAGQAEPSTEPIPTRHFGTMEEAVDWLKAASGG